MTVGRHVLQYKTGGAEKTIKTPKSIEHLLSRRAALLPSRPTGYDWVADDPVVGFVGPALWRFTRSQEQAPGQHDAAHNYWRNAARFTLLRDHLDKIVAELHAADIPVILLKGIVLADTLFASPGLREMGDIDLLVRQEDFVQAAHLLEQLGFTPRPGPFVPLFCDLPEAEARGRDRGARIVPGAGVDGQQRWRPGEWVFYGEDGAMLDLHWHLVPAVWMRRVYRVDIETVWREAEPLTAHELSGALKLSPSHTLAYLCLHVAQHGLQPLRGLFDVDQFVRQSHANSDWSWERFIACIEEWHMRSAAFHVSHFSQHLFGTPVPESVLHRLNPGLAARVRVTALIRPQDLLQHPPVALGRRYPTLVKAALVDCTTDLARLLLQIAIPDITWRRQRYGADVSLKHHWRHVWHVVRRGD